MIKAKLMNYDASEYKMMERDLNRLSMLGYNCNSIDYITFFKKDNKKAYYISDIFVPLSNTQFSKRKEKQDWINDYIDQGFDNIGKIRNVYIFKGQSKNNHFEETDPDLLATYFKGNRFFLKTVLLFLSALLAFIFLPNVFTNSDINEFITNGSIIIHYIPIPFCIIFLFRAYLNLANTRKVSKLLANKKPPILAPLIKYQRYRNIYLYVTIITTMVLALGIALDSFNRKQVAVDSTKVLTLEVYGVDSNLKDYPTMSVKNSLMIPFSYTYFAQSGELDVEKEQYGNILSIAYYETRDVASTKAFASNLIDYPQSSNASKIELLTGYDNVYLSYSKANNQADTMIIIDGKKLIKIATSFDLSDAKYYQPIIEFYLK